MYYLWGRSSKKRKYLDRHILRQISYGNQFLLEDKKVTAEYIAKNPVAGRMVKYMSAEKYMFTGGNEVSYYPMGEDVFEDIFTNLEKAENNKQYL